MEEKSIKITDILSVVKIRQLFEMQNTLNKALNDEEFLLIVAVYNQCIERLLNEELD